MVRYLRQVLRLRAGRGWIHYLEPGDFVHTFGDAHIYLNHLEQARLQYTRQPYSLPKMQINPGIKDIFRYHFEDFNLVDYQAHPHIKAPISV